MEITEGEDVLMRGTDGLIYLGVAVEVLDEDDPSLEEVGKSVLVRFGDGTECWSRKSELRLLGHGQDLDRQGPLRMGGTAAGQDEESPLVKQAKPGTTVVVSSTKASKSQTTQAKTKRRTLRQMPKPSIPLPTPQHVIESRKELPYDFDSLLWDENHQRNDKERQVEKGNCFNAT